MMHGRQRWAAVGSSIALLAMLSTSAAAQQRRPLPQVVLSRGDVTRTRPLPRLASPHNVFGQILAFRGDRFTLRARSGRTVLVDATTAIARGTYSAPLFPGKLVVVNGTVDASHLFHANVVTRMSRIDNQTPPDR